MVFITKRKTEEAFCIIYILLFYMLLKYHRDKKFLVSLCLICTIFYFRNLNKVELALLPPHMIERPP